MPKVTEAHQEARRRQILTAAVKCLSRKGFQRTTLQDICREASLSPGAVYGYFASKEDIIRALADETVARQNELLAQLEQERDPIKALETVIEATIDPHLAATPEGEDLAAVTSRLQVVLWGEAVRSPELQTVFRAGRDRAFSALSQLVVRGQRTGQLDPSLSPQAVVAVVVSLVEGFTLQQTLPDPVGAASYRDAVRGFLRGMSSGREG